MALVQTVDLEVIVDSTLSPPLVSTWVAAHNPMYLEWIREDTEVLDVEGYDSPSKISLIVASNTGYTAGDMVYVNTTWGSGVYEVDSLVSTNRIVLDLLGATTVGTFTGYVNNLTTRKNYYVEIELLNIAQTVSLALLQATPDTTGKVGIDISGAMQSYLSNEDPIPEFILDAYKDENTSKGFRYRTKEVWDGSANSYGTSSDKQFAVNGAFQIGHEENGNYARYYTENNLKTSKFLTDFTELTAWNGYDIDVAFLYSDSVDTSLFTVYGLISYYDYSNILLAATVFPLVLPADENNIIRWKLPVVSQITGTDVQYFELSVNDTTGEILTPMICNVVPEKDIPCPGIYLQWLGEKGNRSYFLFNDLYNESMQVEGSGTYSKAFDRIDTLTEVSDWFNKDAYKKIQLGAEGLTRDQINGLKTLLKSPKVFEVDPVTFKKVGVLVEPGSFNIGRGDDNTFRVEFTMVYPKQFGQSA
jgi:hypothetical protein